MCAYTHTCISFIIVLFISYECLNFNKLWTNGLMDKTLLCNCNEMPFSCVQGGLVQQLF